MTQLQAKGISNLLNERNQLAKKYTSETIEKSKMNFVFIEESTEVIACAENKKVQWYQWEICHVSVKEPLEGKGYGSKILAMAEAKAIKGGAKILQCTIRVGNERSLNLFTRNGYIKTVRFYNHPTGNWVDVLQKSLSNID